MIEESEDPDSAAPRVLLDSGSSVLFVFALICMQDDLYPHACNTHHLRAPLPLILCVRACRVCALATATAKFTLYFGVGVGVSRSYSVSVVSVACETDELLWLRARLQSCAADGPQVQGAS
eukprot:scaffold7121_cov121-Isochrysis_galbana.AAC.12